MTTKFIYFVLIITSFIFGCSNNIKKIALSKGIGSANYELYSKYLKHIDNEIELINLYGLSTFEAVNELKDCDGLLLTGGPDVHPYYFGKTFDTARCSIDSYRDTLEFELIKTAEDLEMPVLAICRGAQIINVAKGGSLIVDIPDDTESQIPHQISGEDVFHDIQIEENSLLNIMSESLSATVNSNHHQAVDRLAECFVISAKTSDGIIEAFENKDKNLPFFLAVQWHPERLEPDSRMSYPIGAEFIKAVRKYNKKEVVKK